MRFIFGFLVGLLTGMLIILGPIVALFVAIGLTGKSEETSIETEEIPIT